MSTPAFLHCSVFPQSSPLFIMVVLFTELNPKATLKHLLDGNDTLFSPAWLKQINPGLPNFALLPQRLQCRQISMSNAKLWASQAHFIMSENA